LIDSVGSNVLNLYPLPTNTDPTAPNYFTQNYLTTQKRINDQDSFDIRVDHQLRASDLLFVSYAFSDCYAPAWDRSGRWLDYCPSISNRVLQHLRRTRTYFSSTY
jgi:hypothetical protein